MSNDPQIREDDLTMGGLTRKMTRPVLRLKNTSGNEINNCVTLNSVVYILCKVYIANICDAQQWGTKQDFTKYEV